MNKVLVLKCSACIVFLSLWTNFIVVPVLKSTFDFHIDIEVKADEKRHKTKETNVVKHNNFWSCGRTFRSQTMNEYVI